MHRYRLICYLLLLSLCACNSLSFSPAPQRSFSVMDLLLDASNLPQGWKGDLQNQTGSCHALDFQNCTQVGYLSLRDDVSIDQWIARFKSNYDADVAYFHHDFAHNTYGQYGITWVVVKDFDYVSPFANRYRLVCQSKTMDTNCFIEARYEEYLVDTQYVGKDPGRALNDLRIIAMAVDKKMEDYLKKP